MSAFELLCGGQFSLSAQIQIQSFALFHTLCNINTKLCRRPANPKFVFLFQFLILVVDSTDRERLAVTKAELCNMLNHEVWMLFHLRCYNILSVYVSVFFLTRFQSVYICVPVLMTII